MTTLTRKETSSHAPRHADRGGSIGWIAAIAALALLALAWVTHNQAPAGSDQRARISIPSSHELPAMPNPEPMPMPAPAPLGG